MKVVLTDAAEEDLAAIYTYYAERSGPAADRVVGLILKAINGLGLFPLMGRPGGVPETRERIVTRYPYRVVYHVDEANQTVEVWRAAWSTPLAAGHERGRVATPYPAWSRARANSSRDAALSATS